MKNEPRYRDRCSGIKFECGHRSFFLRQLVTFDYCSGMGVENPAVQSITEGDEKVLAAGRTARQYHIRVRASSKTVSSSISWQLAKNDPSWDVDCRGSAGCRSERVARVQDHTSTLFDCVSVDFEEFIIVGVGRDGWIVGTRRHGLGSIGVQGMCENEEVADCREMRDTIVINWG